MTIGRRRFRRAQLTFQSPITRRQATASRLGSCSSVGFLGAYNRIRLTCGNADLSTHAPFDKASLASIGAVGTVALAIQYIIPIGAPRCSASSEDHTADHPRALASGLIRLFVRYPDWVKTALWTSTVVSGGSMIVSSWATEVSRIDERRAFRN